MVQLGLRPGAEDDVVPALRQTVRDGKANASPAPVTTATVFCGMDMLADGYMKRGRSGYCEYLLSVPIIRSR